MDKDSFFGYEQSERSSVIKKLSSYLKEGEAESFEEKVIYLEKLSNATVKMKIEFLGMVDMRVLARSFKFCTKDFLKKFLGDLSSNIKIQILNDLQVQYKLGDVMTSVEEIVFFIKKLEGTGSLILDNSEEYV